jgi:hypothetical protein
MRISAEAEIGLSFRNASKAVVLCTNGYPVSHYIRFAQEMAEVVTLWPPFPVPSSAAALGYLVAHAVTEQVVVERIRSAAPVASFIEQDKRAFESMIGYLHATHVYPKNALGMSSAIPYGLFVESCRLIVGNNMRALENNDDFRAANVYVADRLQTLGQMRGEDLRNFVSETFGLMAGRGRDIPRLVGVDEFHKLWKGGGITL